MIVCVFRKIMILRISQNILRKNSLSTACRNFSFSSTLSNVQSIPCLMEFPNLVSPRISHSLRNKFLEKTLITPYFDPEFSLSEFNSGAKQAAAIVANNLAHGDLDKLENLITSEALDDLRKNLRLLKNSRWYPDNPNT